LDSGPVQQARKGNSELLSVFQNIGPLQVIIVLVIVLLLFGVGKLPQVGKGMGQAINEFKSAIGSKSDDSDSDSDSDSGDQNTGTKTT
jgi:sec-independent protein translocase protein TatA